ncbi:hypothetical protein EJ02DRAFT_113172 [Clathrospora elynae]|uniref:Uncharacterized protein n=1 Tax=Clathrospora elynae TaxID=706981 RepID=A0A6A5S7N3_9PLEO|nr:hypothetical protein EJ02DRAFT_113172 [Clathrospora elynae]
MPSHQQLRQPRSHCTPHGPCLDSSRQNSAGRCRRVDRRSRQPLLWLMLKIRGLGARSDRGRRDPVAGQVLRDAQRPAAWVLVSAQEHKFSNLAVHLINIICSAIHIIACTSQRSPRPISFGPGYLIATNQTPAGAVPTDSDPRSWLGSNMIESNYAKHSALSSRSFCTATINTVVERLWWALTGSLVHVQRNVIHHLNPFCLSGAEFAPFF